MAAIVATLAYGPVGLLLALGFALFGISFQAALTFGGAFGTFTGLAAWWLLAYAAAWIYAAFTFPWED
jgi:hypothetical protein